MQGNKKVLCYVVVITVCYGFHSKVHKAKKRDDI